MKDDKDLIIEMFADETAGLRATVSVLSGIVADLVVENLGLQQAFARQWLERLYAERQFATYQRRHTTWTKRPRRQRRDV